MSKRFLETSNYIEDNDEADADQKGVHIKPYYYDEIGIVEKLGAGDFYKESYFSTEISETAATSVNVDEAITK